MIVIGKESKLVPFKVIEKAVAFFGPSGQGMDVIDRGDCCARFEGSGGYVFVQAADIEDKKGSNVTIEGREWEFQVKQFLGKI